MTAYLAFPDYKHLMAFIYSFFFFFLLEREFFFLNKILFFICSAPVHEL